MCAIVAGDFYLWYFEKDSVAERLIQIFYFILLPIGLFDEARCFLKIWWSNDNG